MAVMPEETRETGKLYLDGQIRQWYRAATARGSSLVGAKTEDEARALVKTLSLAKERLMITITFPSDRLCR